MVHSDIAKHASRFKVNGNIHPFDKPLHNGDVVEVETKRLPQAKQPWLDLVTSAHAKAKLRAQLRGMGLIEGISGAAAIIRHKARRKKKN